jgi:hypothetical protein
VRTWDLEEFISEATKELAESGLWEREIAATSHQFGHIAQVFSTYETRVGTAQGLPARRGINSIQLLDNQGQWAITSLIYDIERPWNPIPDHYLPLP